MHSFVSRLSTFFIPIRMATFLGRGWFCSSERRAIIAISYRVLWSIARNARQPAPVPLWFRGTPITVVLESSADFALIREVFLDEEYRHAPLKDPTYIFDVGANVGVASLYFHCLYPHARMYAFEPDPVLFGKLSIRMSDIPQIIPLQIALSDRDGETSFYRHGGSPLAGSLISRAGDTEPVQVKTRRLSSITAELGINSIDLLKFDIEGAERMLFASSEDRACAEHLIGEVHLDVLDMTTEEFIALFPDFDLTYVSQTAQSRYIVFGEKHVVS